jgi:fumarate hydratase class II
MSTRIDRDTMGDVTVPAAAYYGPQTARSLENFPIGRETMPPDFIKAYAIVKQASALTNTQLKLLSEDKNTLISQACEEIINGGLADQFPLKIWQTGSGTQTNMNLNEVIANRANTLAGQKLGSNKPIHPNDDVNLGQSTNDSFPTVMHVAAARMTHERLLPELASLIATFEKKSQDFMSVIKMGRTHLQDATPITLGQELSGYASQLKMAQTAITSSLPGIYELALGGTAVGTGLNCHPDFAVAAARAIATKTKLPFITAPNKFAALGGNDACVWLSGALNVLACAFMKIANDIRWLASGPRGGLGEITIAENEPGSSIMPGKVNPTQSEAATMVCCQVMGNHTAISMACSQGHFELNVFKPVIMKNLLDSIELLADALSSFDLRCARSIEPNYPRLAELKDRSLMLVTALAPHLGYEQAANIAKKAHKEGKTLKEVCLELGLMSAEQFDERVRPEDMLRPNLVPKK